MDDNLLEEERFLIEVRHGGLSAIHLITYSTFPAWDGSGKWTRRAAHRQAACGAKGALVMGCDASEWPTVPEPPANWRDEVTCKRCLARGGKRFPDTL